MASRAVWKGQTRLSLVSDYRVVRDALRRPEKIGIGQLTMRGREYLCALRACGAGLLLETLHYTDEIREAEPLFSRIEDDPAEDELQSVAEQLIEKKSAPFDAAACEAHCDQALRALIDEKTKSRTTRRAPRDERAEARPEGENVVDLMHTLKKTLGTSGGVKSKTTTSRSKAGKTAGSSRTRKQA